MSGIVNIDSKSMLVDALKADSENFGISNLIFKNGRSLKAVFAYYGLKSDLMEFAKDSTHSDVMGPPPTQPNTANMSEEDAAQAIYDYYEMRKVYQQQKEAASMHIPYADYMQIRNYLDKYVRTLHATPAIKGNRFYAFTKNIEEEKHGLFDFLKGGD